MASSKPFRLAVVGLVLIAAGCDAPAGSEPSGIGQGARDAAAPYAFGDDTKPCYTELFALYNASVGITGTKSTSAAGLQRIIDGLQTKANDAYYAMSQVPPKADGAQQKLTDYDAKLLSGYDGNKLSSEDMKQLRGVVPPSSPDLTSPLGAAQACVAGFQG